MSCPCVKEEVEYASKKPFFSMEIQYGFTFPVSRNDTLSTQGTDHPTLMVCDRNFVSGGIWVGEKE
jgi:hypothetical protein